MQAATGEMFTSRIEKRNRPPTSCEPCRNRKLKCNRALPCNTCIQRNKRFSCEYAANANRSKPSRASVGDRLRNLEDIVSQCIQNGVPITRQGTQTYRRNDNKDYSEASVAEVPKTSAGFFHIQDGQVNYVDSNHWLSILDDVREVRRHLTLSDIGTQESLFDDGSDREREPDLTISPMPRHSIHEILRSLPPRAVCDSLLSRYFNQDYVVLPILHPTKFQNEYENFWQDSSETPIIWIGLLYAILSIGATLNQTGINDIRPVEATFSADNFRLRTRQCIILGKYFTARAYGVETLVLHLLSNFMGLVDSNVSLWFLMGIIIRLAMRLGYHRDPKANTAISAFDGEMRRRTWAIIYQLDILMSFQLGLPSMIPSNYCDTEAPRNLHYSDFAPDMAVLPPPRPLSESTPVLYTIVKGKIMNMFKLILGHTQALSPGPLEVTMMLDREMHGVYDNIPPNLKMKPVCESFMDAASTIMHRVNIELLYLKATVVLHRYSLQMTGTTVGHVTSQRQCVDAALRILRIQKELHDAAQPGGLMYDHRWMVSSLNTHDFLLAAMVVCLWLSAQGPADQMPRSEGFTVEFDALQTSHKIWASASSYSKEAHTAAQALEVMIHKTKDCNQVNTLSNQSAPIDDLLRDGNLLYAEPMIDMLSSTDPLDWALLDQYFQNNGGTHDTSPVVSHFGFNENTFE